jgi:miniconductance mechanosensitive channel
MESEIGKFILDLLKDIGIAGKDAQYIKIGIMVAFTLIICIIADYITKRVIIVILRKIILRTKTIYDDILLKRKVFDNLAHIIPAIIFYYALELAFAASPTLVSFLRSATYIYIIIVVLIIFYSLFNALHEIYQTFPISNRIPIKGYIQVIKIVLYFIGFILILSILLKKSPIFLFTGLGALAAVLMLIFKDTILGVVAHIQLSTLDMLKIGDWISIKNRETDGIVIEMSVTIVKVQNWDNTITTIPTYSLVSESFKNWKGMQESGGRRIKRAINIDMKSIKFLTNDMIEKFQKIEVLKEYIFEKKTEIDNYNLKNNLDKSVVINSTAMTNLGTFRKYLENYLRNHPEINSEMTLLIRQLPSSESGIPIEIYCFSRLQDLVPFEQIQSDIFDHVLAVIPEFELKVFQNPTGEDMRAAMKPS